MVHYQIVYHNQQIKMYNILIHCFIFHILSILNLMFKKQINNRR